MVSTRVIALLKEIGLPAELLASAADDWELRADLGLSSAETLELQLMLEQLGCVGFSLWDTHDHALRELEQLIETASAAAASASDKGSRVGGER